MTHITLPSPDNADLLVTFKSESGKFIGFEWAENSEVTPSDKAALIASTKAALFSDGFLDLSTLIALRVDYTAKHEAACSALSQYQDANGFDDTPESIRLDIAVGKACKTESRITDIVAVCPAQSGLDLALKVIALVDGHKFHDVRFEDRLGLRADAARILAHANA